MTQSDNAAGYPSPGHAWRVVALIVVVAIVATLDRGVLSLVIDPVRRDLSITDVQVGLLQGLSFSLFYATVGVALGLWTDRVTRTRLLAFGMLVWSLSTVAAGLSTGFKGMFLSRLLVGMGEGTLGPCAISLICDLFPPRRRGRPMGLYMTGQAVSNGLSVLLTGAIIRHSPGDWVVHLPQGVVALHPWRIAFIVTGLLGCIVAPALLALQEPARQEAVTVGDRLPIGASFRLLWGLRRQLLPLYFGLAAIAAGFYSTLAWGAVSISRHYDISITQVAALLGPVSIVAGLVGPSLFGMLVDRIMRHSGARDRLRLLAMMPVLMLPTMAGALMPNPILAILCLAAMLGAYPALATVFFSALQGAVPNELRGFSISLIGLTNALIGATGGPLLVAELSQHALSGHGATATALSLVLIVSMVVGIAFFILAWQRNLTNAAPALAGQPPLHAASRS